MKYLKYFLIVFILILSPNVFAAEFNMNNLTSATKNGTTNRYQGYENYEYGQSVAYTFNNRYTGRLGMIDTYFNYPFEKNTTYRLTYNMSTEDFRNNFGSSYWWDCYANNSMTNLNTTVVSPVYVSYKKVTFTFTPKENTTCISVSLRSKNINTQAFTGVSNWNLSSITLYDPDYQSGGGSGQGSTPSATPTPTPNDYSSIINNQTENTQDIINNQNENTSSIIENNNQNTQDIINNQNELLGEKCENLVDLPDLELSRIDENHRTKNIYFPNEISSGTYTLSYNYESGNSPDTYVQVLLTSGSTSTITTLHLDSTGKNTFVANTSFNRFYVFIANTSPASSYANIRNIMLVKGSTAKPYCAFGSYHSKLDDTTDAINKQTDYLMDNSDPNISDNEFTSLFDSVSFNDPLSYLLQLPVQLINTLINNSNSCTTINLGSLYGTMLSLPCINIGNIIGSQVWDIIDVILSVSLLVVIFKNLYQTFANLITLGGEKEAREKFSMPTPMEFLSFILGGDR